jgi:hypothetical protein
MVTIHIGQKLTQKFLLHLTLSVCAEYIYSAASHASHPDGVLKLRAFHKVVKSPMHGQKDSVFFFSGHLIYILKQERFRAFRPAGGV